MSVIRLDGVGKTYALYRHGFDRMSELVSGKSRHEDFVALKPINLSVEHGEVLGVLGMNGAGKSTLLKLLAGTLVPSCGSLVVRGQVAALLELGTGFHPDMSGRDNVYVYASVMGMSRKDTDRMYPEIVEFSGLADFMDHPVKTYSSGMYVRLAFSVATSVNPDILIVDEALSVGDGAFARRSFDRIMGFRKSGKTIVFCSHSLYQIEAVCSRAIWLHRGEVMMSGDPSKVVAEYGGFLAEQEGRAKEGAAGKSRVSVNSVYSHARILGVKLRAGGRVGRDVELTSGVDDLYVEIEFQVDPILPRPTLGIALAGPDGRPVCSALSLQDGVILERSTRGRGEAIVCFPKLALLKGHYTVQIYLACENSIHAYEEVLDAGGLTISQIGLEQGVVSLPRKWAVTATQ